jgi:dephospho-CoA kinase
VSSQDRRWLLSGGIGSGKSEVRRLLAAHGVRTVDADSVGHVVLEEDALDAVSKRWPQVIVNGTVERSKLAEVVFDDPIELAALETITHPLIFGRIAAELEGFDGIAIVEMPVMRNWLGWPRMVVDATEGTQQQRAVSRGMDLDGVRARLAAQPTRAAWLASADLVIPNHGTLAELEVTVSRVLALWSDEDEPTHPASGSRRPAAT